MTVLIPILLSAFASAAHAVPAVTCTLNVTRAEVSKPEALNPLNPYFQVRARAYSDLTVLVSPDPSHASLAGYELNADMTTRQGHFVMRLNLANDQMETGTQVYLANENEPITLVTDHVVVTLQANDDVATVRCRQHSF